MISRFVRLCSAGLPLAVLSCAFAQSPSPLPQNPPAAAQPVGPAAAPAQVVNTPEVTDNEPVSMNFAGIDIDGVLDMIQLYTGKVILLPPALPAAPTGYTLKTTKPITKSQAVLYLETMLAMNGIAVIPMGEDALKIVQLNAARVEAPELIWDSTLNLPPSSALASKLFQLEFLRAQEFQTMLATLSNPNLGGQVLFPNANAILITDSISNLQRIETLLKEMDRPIAGGMATKFYQLRNGAKASDVVNKIRTMLQPIQQQIGTGTSYSADDRANQVILITDRRQVEFFDDLIARLDVKADPNTRNDVIYLKHAKAADMATVLTSIVKGQNQVSERSQSTRLRQGTQPDATPRPLPAAGGNAANATPTVASLLGDSAGSTEFSAYVTVVPDERSNSIVVSGTTDDISLLKQLIDKLDIVLAQVRIEVVITEVTLTNNNETGVSSLGLQLDGDRLVGFAGSGAGIALSGIGNTTYASTSRLGGPGSLGRSIDLTGIVTLGTSATKSNTIILSHPTITTSHAKEANIFVGESRPIVSGTVSSSLGGGSTSTTTMQKIGIDLTVTPLIGVDGSVQLDIKQTVDEVGGETEIDGNKVPIVLNRTTSSFVSVKNGEIIVLGGLQRKYNSKSRSRLGPIPIIGDLFGPRTNDNTRSELIFFLRPYVLTNTPADNVEALKRVDGLPQRDDILRQLTPGQVPPEKKPMLDRILPR
ncbi:secretin N-terminal domain-containing protein [Opitutus sp. ER46]|uniref:secretin N-terminal domain-containing protein n=1 Tax=Opitutus sp. ER46 TaxID=2161864 RepID=UPI000D31115E|nr:secretin N-terminal domain-containing protein [Opitutus sp. ER46]PTX91649.1 type II secretory pathway, component PulD [Opitutus sp. ER46]